MLLSSETLSFFSLQMLDGIHFYLSLASPYKYTQGKIHFHALCFCTFFLYNLYHISTYSKPPEVPFKNRRHPITSYKKNAFDALCFCTFSYFSASITYHLMENQLTSLGAIQQRRIGC